MQNEYYMEVQQKLFDFLDLPDYDIIVKKYKTDVLYKTTMA
jgi:hypothetical protein